MSFEHPETTVLSTEVSDNGQSVSTQMAVGAFGVYDPEKQLTPEGISKLKDTLRADADDRGELIGRICTHIVINMLTEGYEETSEDELATAQAEGDEPEILIGEGGRYENPHEFARHTGLLAVHWALGLKQAIDLPGAEWIEGMTPPATFAEALKEIQGLDFRGRKQVDG